MNRIIISKSLVYSIILWSSIVTVSGQVSQKIGGNPGTIDPKAVLELESTTKGFLLPRMTALQVAAIANPTSGMIVFCTDCGVGSDGELRISYNGVWQTYKGNVTGNITGNAATVTTNANLSGPITSSGNTTSVASQTGTGSTFVMNTSPTLVTPVLGAATATTINSTTIPDSKTLVVTTDKLNVLSATSSSELAGVISDETGTGNVVLSNSPTFTGSVTAPIYASTPQALTDGATISWNPTSGLNASVTLGGNRTLSFASTPAVGSYGTLIVTQDATGNRTITLPSSLTNKVLGSATSTIDLSTAANAKDILNFYYDGTNCYWNIGQGYGTDAPAVITNLATNVSGTLAVANGGSGSTTLTGYVKGNGTSAMTASSTIPVADVTGAAPLASPTFTGTPTLPTGTIGVTQTAGNNSTALATTAFVTAANTTNANLSGPITSSGNTTSVASQTGTGSTFVMNTSPTLVTPVLGAATGTSLSVTGQLTSTVATGTAPLVVTSTTPVANLNIGGNAATVTTNANLTGVVTSTGNATAIADGALSIAKTSGLQTTIDAKVADAINDATTTVAPSQNAVFDALALKAPIASPTFTGTVTSPIYASTPQALTDGATISWNPTSGLNASVTLGGNRTLSFASTPAVGSYGTLIVTQDATGNRTITLPSALNNKVLGSSSTTTIALSTAANAKDILNFYYDGANCYWNVGQGYGTAAPAVITNLATNVSGTLAVANGGSGSTTLTGYVKGNGTSAMTASSTIPVADVTGAAPLASPTFTGTPTLPTGTIGVTQTAGDNTTALATTAFVTAANGTNANLTGMVTSVGNTTTVVTNANLSGAVTSSGNTTSLGSFTSANLATALTDETGTGVAVLATSPTLVTPVLGAATGTSLSVTGQLTSTVATGTAPLVVTSTTPVTNLNIGGNAATVTTNANLSGAVTSSGNTTSLGSFTSANLATALTDETGTGVAVLATSPTLVTPVLGAATGTSLSVTGQLTSTVATGTAPLVVTSTTPVANLNIGGNAATVTTNANLSGVVTSSGNTTAIADGALSIAKTSGLQTTIDAKVADAINDATTTVAPSQNAVFDALALKAPIASPTFTGTVTSPIYASTPQALTDGATISWNPTSGLNASVTLGGNRTLSFASTPAVGSYGTLIVTQDATGNRTITLPSALNNKVLGSSSTTTIALSTAANAKDILNFYYDGANCYWNVGQGYGTAAPAVITNLATNVSGTLAVANGGSGSTTLTGYVKGNGTSAMTASSTIPVADVTGAAPLASPTFTGTPTLPTGTIGVTQTAGDNTTALATTAFVTAANGTNANLTGMVTSVGNTTTVVTNANLSGAVTSSGNTTSLGSFSSANLASALSDETGTGVAVLATSPTLVTPVLGAATGTSLSVTGQLTSTVATGTAPLVVTSTTPVANLNIGGNAATVTTNANLTGVVTSTGNATAIADGALSIAKTSGLQTTIDAKVADAINDATTTVAPSQNAVFDALALKAPIASPTFTGTPTLPTGTIGVTQTAGDNTTALATTAFVTAANATNANLTGVVTSSGNTTAIADGALSIAKTIGLQTTIDAKVADAINDATTTVAPSQNAVFDALALKAPIASPTFTGTPTLPTGTIGVTQTAGDNTTALATTAFVTAANGTNANLTGVVTSTGNTTAIAAGVITNTMLANTAVANLSGTNTGDNAVNSLYSGLVSNATHTGDVTGATTLTLATVNTSVGSFGTSTSVPTFTVNGKGLVTAASATAIPTATATTAGLLTSTDWTTFNNKQGTITLSTTGTSGASSFTSNTLNIPTYTLSGLGGQPLATNLTSIGGLTNATGVLVNNGTGTFSYSTTPTLTGTNFSGVPYTALSGTVPTWNQNTTGTSANVTGTVAVGNGGTGATSLTGMVKGTGTTAMTAATAGTDYSVGTSALASGIVKSTTSTGALSIAVAGTDYIAPYTSQTANFILASPSGSAGTPSFRALTATDIPTLNQNTTGNAATATATGITDDATTSTTVYPTFVAGTSGNLPQKVTSTKLSFVPSTGALTATKFVKSGGTSAQFLMADGSVSSGTPLLTEADIEVTATAAGQTSFALTQTPSSLSKVKMYINGIRISNTAYTISGSTLTYIPANNESYSISVGDRVQFEFAY